MSSQHLLLHTPHGPLYGQLELPPAAHALIVLARARHQAVDTAIIAHLASRGYALAGLDLLTAQEAHFVDATQNVARLTERLLDLLTLLRRTPGVADLPLGIFASGDSTPAAIRAAAQRDSQVRALACHGGLVDRAGLQALTCLRAPLLLLVDAGDHTARLAFERARPHLQSAQESHELRGGEDPLLRVAAWFGLFLG